MSYSISTSIVRSLSWNRKGRTNRVYQWETQAAEVRELVQVVAVQDTCDRFNSHQFVLLLLLATFNEQYPNNLEETISQIQGESKTYSYGTLSSISADKAWSLLSLQSRETASSRRSCHQARNQCSSHATLNLLPSKYLAVPCSARKRLQESLQHDFSLLVIQLALWTKITVLGDLLNRPSSLQPSFSATVSIALAA